MNRKIIFTLALLIATITTQAQRDREFQIRAGLGTAGYATHYSQTYTIFGINITNEEDDGAVTVHMPIEFRYEIGRRFNAGLDLKFGSYLYDPSDSSTTKSNNFSSVGIAGEATVVSNDNFRWYVGLQFNTTNLELNEDFENGIVHQQQWRGGGTKFNTGILAYLGDGPLGLNANLGYDRHNFKLQSFTINGNDQNLDNFKATLDVRGVELNVGLVLRIR